MTPRDTPELLVIGAGVIGATAAVEALRRGHQVEVWTRDPPEATTSAVAAAMWYPFLAEPRERVLAWSLETFEELARLARDTPAAGVRMTPFREFFTAADPDVPRLAQVPGARWLSPAEVAPPSAAVLELTVPVADSRVHLPWLHAEIRRLGGRIERRAVGSLDELQGAARRAVLNCTGLGARELCGDSSLVPIRGQVAVVRAPRELTGLIDDTGPYPVYVIPRGSGPDDRELILGGTAQRADERTNPDSADMARILAACVERRPELQGLTPLRAAVGLRPFRPEIRLEREVLQDGTLVVHDYGHGGSGYTVAWGCAREALALVSGRGGFSGPPPVRR